MAEPNIWLSLLSSTNKVNKVNNAQVQNWVHTLLMSLLFLGFLYIPGYCTSALSRAAAAVAVGAALAACWPGLCNVGYLTSDSDSCVLEVLTPYTQSHSCVDVEITSRLDQAVADVF